MYDYIKGKIIKLNSNSISLENNNLGYLIYVANPYEFKEGEETIVYLYQVVKEDELSLYGFKIEEERELFLKLIQVKGVGPKTALPILATGSVSGVVDAIERENILYLKKFPKIGDKVAKQIILDLKGKLKNFDVGEVSLSSYEEVIEVLKSLGYKDKEINTVVGKINKDLSLENQIKEALKLLLK